MVVPVMVVGEHPEEALEVRPAHFPDGLLVARLDAELDLVVVVLVRIRGIL
jgi:hypothetical protein